MCLPEGAPVFARVKFTALVAVVAGAVLLPLYGDPRNAPVTHPEWARMLLRALRMDTAFPESASAAQAFAALSWKNSLAFSADRYVREAGVEVQGDGRGRRVVATDAEGEVAYAL